MSTSLPIGIQQLGTKLAMKGRLGARHLPATLDPSLALARANKLEADTPRTLSGGLWPSRQLLFTLMRVRDPDCPLVCGARAATRERGRGRENKGTMRIT